MVIHLGSGKKGKVQVGRNFVRPFNNAQSVYDVIDAWKGITSAAKKKRTAKRIKALNEDIIKEVNLEKSIVSGLFGKRLAQGQDKILTLCNLRATQTRKINAFAVAELDLPTSKRRKLAVLLAADANLYFTYSMLSNNRGVSRVELIGLLKQGLERTSALDAKFLANAPIIAQNKKVIAEIIKILTPLKAETVRIDPSAIDTLKYANDYLVKKLLGGQYTQYQEIFTRATKNVPLI